MSYEFHRMLHSTTFDMCDAIAQQWLSAGGEDHAEMRKLLDTMTDEELAAECIEAWGLDQDNWMEDRDIAAGDIELAFDRLRDPQRFTKAFGED